MICSRVTASQVPGYSLLLPAERRYRISRRGRKAAKTAEKDKRGGTAGRRLRNAGGFRCETRHPGSRFETAKVFCAVARKWHSEATLGAGMRPAKRPLWRFRSRRTNTFAVSSLHPATPLFDSFPSLRPLRLCVLCEIHRHHVPHRIKFEHHRNHRKPAHSSAAFSSATRASGLSSSTRYWRVRGGRGRSSVRREPTQRASFQAGSS